MEVPSDWEKHNKLYICFTEQLKKAFYNRHLSHYFIRDINVFGNVADEIVLYGQAILE